MDEEPKGSLFKDIDADDEPETTAIESLCLSCEKNVSTAWKFYKFYSVNWIIPWVYLIKYCGVLHSRTLYMHQGIEILAKQVWERFSYKELLCKDQIINEWDE